MTTTGDVNITLLDGSAGAVVVPASQVQLVMGCSSSGSAAQIVATRSLTTLSSSFGYGPLVEAAGLIVQAGGTVLAMKTTQNAAGYVRGSDASPLTVTGASNATPIVITTAANTLVDGQVVTVADVGGNTAANGTWVINQLTTTTFELVGSIGNSAWTSGGTVQPTGVGLIGTGTSVPTVTLDGTIGAFDDYYVKIVVVHGGTRGTAGITFKVSLDAGRNYGPVIALGTATSYAIPNTGVTWALAAGTLVAGDVITCGTVAPAWATSGISACIAVFQASQYAVTGIGSTHVVGPCSGANASTIAGYFDTLATGYIFGRVKLDVRDASPPILYGGTAEADATWAAAIISDFSAVSAKRALGGAGFYNMPTAFPAGAGGGYAGAPRYRRPLTWAEAARQVQIPPQRHSGRVKDGSLSPIVVDPTNDPLDGFNYHDERLNPSLDILTGGSGRFCSARTRVGLPGFYIVNPLLLSPLGSDFTFWPYGAVMDVACSIVHQVGQQTINDDVRLNTNGTIYENEARAIEADMTGALNDQMTSTGMISSAVAVVTRTNNVQTTKTVIVTVTITARGYVLQEDVSIGFANPYAASAA